MAHTPGDGFYQEVAGAAAEVRLEAEFFGMLAQIGDQSASLMRNLGQDPGPMLTLAKRARELADRAAKAHEQAQTALREAEGQREKIGLPLAMARVEADEKKIDVTTN